MATEFGGEDNVPANVQPKNPAALTPSEMLRLTYLTGQTTNPRAPRDGGRAWTGQSDRRTSTST